MQNSSRGSFDDIKHSEITADKIGFFFATVRLIC